MRTHHEGHGPPVALGIDLGTSHSRVGVWKDNDVLIIPNERGKLATPSCVAFTDHCVLVGEAAEEQADVNLENTIFAPQKLIGSKFENPWVQWYMKLWPGKVARGDGDRPLIRVRDRGKERCVRPEDILTLLLEHLRKTAERYLGVTAMEAVITIPAQYGQTQREALIEASRGARLKVLDLVKAPTAAAIAFSLTNPCKGRRYVLVLDVGASYFNFSLMTVEGQIIAEKAIGTDCIDLDNCMVQFCVQDLRERYAVNIATRQDALLRLRCGCELAKRKLSQWNQARIEVGAIVEGVDYAVNISRGHFEDFCRSDIETLMDPVDWCLEDCGLDRANIDVVLVGGSARVPRIRRAVREFFYGRAPREVLRPDHAAVLGAAVYVSALANAQGDVAGVPPCLRDLQLVQVKPWVSPDDQSQSLSDNGSRSTDSLGMSPLPLDQLDSVPCNEAGGLPRPAAKPAFKTASGAARAKPASGRRPPEALRCPGGVGM